MTASPDCPDDAEFSITWTRRYPSAAIQHLIQLYVTLETIVRFRSIGTPLIAFANPQDMVCDFRVTQRNVSAMPCAELQSVTDTVATHAITGRLCSPGSVKRIVEDSVRFLREHVLA